MKCNIQMKKVFLLVVILGILFIRSTFAQSLKIGITAGLNVSNTTIYSDNIFKAGFQAGVVADFGMTDKLSIIPELLFSQRGYKNKHTRAYDLENPWGYLIDEPITSTLNYLQLPINIAYKFDVEKDSKIIVFIGPYLGYMLSANMNGTYAVIKRSDGSRYDFGMNAGAGYQYKKIFVKLQYNQGIVNLLKSSQNIIPKGISMRNINIALTVGYFFN